jgi:hypothetical protein
MVSDEVFLKINGVQHYLWRAVDQQGAVIDILVQPKRDRFAAVRFFRKLLRSSRRRPRMIITDKLRSYGAAKKVVLLRVAHRQSRYLNNRAENSHQPTRQRERRMKRFKSPEHAQRFLEVHGIVAAHFRPKRHLLSAADYRAERRCRFETWQKIIAAWNSLATEFHIASYPITEAVVESSGLAFSSRDSAAELDAVTEQKGEVNWSILLRVARSFFTSWP